MFVVPLVLGTCVLIPGQPRSLLGLELLATGLLGCSLMLWLHRPSNRVGQEARVYWLAGSTIPSAVVGGLAMVGGATLIAGHGGGLYWIAPAIVIAFATGLVGAWVLLVEILR